MKEIVKRYILPIEWTLGALVVMLPLISWLGGAQLNDLNLYEVFPPLGLIAFGLMWTHFVTGALRRYSHATARQSDTYMVISMAMVLALILLHPGLLWLALFVDGYGLPPQSYMTVYSTQLGYIALGTISLVIFLAFELKRFFGQRSWWKYIEQLQVLGMVAIFIHAIGLGGELKVDWFFAVWIMYGVTLAASVVYSRFIYNKN